MTCRASFLVITQSEQGRQLILSFIVAAVGSPCTSLEEIETYGGAVINLLCNYWIQWLVAIPNYPLTLILIQGDIALIKISLCPIAVLVRLAFFEAGVEDDWVRYIVTLLRSKGMLLREAIYRCVELEILVGATLLDHFK